MLLLILMGLLLLADTRLLMLSHLRLTNMLSIGCRCARWKSWLGLGSSINNIVTTLIL